MCASQQCKTHSSKKILHKCKIPTNDYKHRPLFMIEKCSFGTLFHNCVFHFAENTNSSWGFKLADLQKMYCAAMLVVSGRPVEHQQGYPHAQCVDRWLQF